jgi:SPP1 gp7 family putative phage head morphogenesis protein
LGKPLPSINRKSVIKAEKQIQTLFKKYFIAQRKAILNYLEANVMKASYSQVSIEALIAELRAAQASPRLVRKLEALLEKITAETSTLTLAAVSREIGTQFADDVFNLVNNYAKEYAATRTGSLITDIGETTLNVVREKLGIAIDTGMSVKEYADLIDASGVFGDKRAMLIARTESSLAHNEGAVQSYIDSGVVEGKEWLIANDACDECLPYNGEVVGVNEVFSNGEYSPPLHPNCRCTTIPVVNEDLLELSESVELQKAETYKPTEAMAEEARRALKWKAEGRAGGTRVGLARANQLAKRENLSESTVKRMFSFFSRHEVDKQGKGFYPGEGYPSKGRVAWALWGGDAAFSWSRRIVESLKNKD